MPDRGLSAVLDGDVRPPWATAEALIPDARLDDRGGSLRCRRRREARARARGAKTPSRSSHGRRRCPTRAGFTRRAKGRPQRAEDVGRGQATRRALPEARAARKAIGRREDSGGTVPRSDPSWRARRPSSAFNPPPPSQASTPHPAAKPPTQPKPQKRQRTKQKTLRQTPTKPKTKRKQHSTRPQRHRTKRKQPSKKRKTPRKREKKRRKWPNRDKPRAADDAI